MEFDELTIVQARARLAQLAEQHARLLDRVTVAAKRIHEFAPATRDYDMATKAFSLRDIDLEFARACATTRDADGMAGRTGLTADQIREIGSKCSTNEPHVIRLTATRNGNEAAYAMPFSEGKQDFAHGLMNRFRDTLIRHGWEITYFGAAPAALPDDNLLAEA